MVYDGARFVADQTLRFTGLASSGTHPSVHAAGSPDLGRGRKSVDGAGLALYKTTNGGGAHPAAAVL